MGADQAASVVTQVRADSAKSKGEKWSEADRKKYFEEIQAQYNQQTDAVFATARLWDDGIIEPTETRAALGLALSLAPMPQDGTARAFGTFSM
jgi:3-methylcrotonyl-CoA carboxylase beta subunit